MSAACGNWKKCRGVMCDRKLPVKLYPLEKAKIVRTVSYYN